jgi:hypothetical protein
MIVVQFEIVIVIDTIDIIYIYETLDELSISYLNRQSFLHYEFPW